MPSSSLEIFRGYDVRGRFGDTLFLEDAFFIGYGFVQLVSQDIQNPCIVVARDGRLHSPVLAQELMKGLSLAGARVIDIGLGPTPYLYWAVQHLGAQGGVVVTASHNPPEDNGFKFVKGNAPFYGEPLRELGKLTKILRNNKPLLEQKEAQEKEVGTKQSLHTTYVQSLIQESDIDQLEGLRVAWDLGHGAVCTVFDTLLKKLKGHHHVLYGAVNGTFPAHLPDPTVPKNVKALMQEVVEEGYDLGLAFDGDGDRVTIVDNKGELWAGDDALCLLAQHVLKEHPQSLILSDIKCGNHVASFIQALGGHFELCATGHVHMKREMKKRSGALGAEISGHVVFASLGYDDALYAALRILQETAFLKRQGLTLSAWRQQLPTHWVSPEYRVHCEGIAPQQMVSSIEQQMQKTNYSVLTLDGIRVQMPQGWFLLRASQTEPVVVVRIEGNTHEALEELHHFVSGLLRPWSLVLPSLQEG